MAHGCFWHLHCCALPVAGKGWGTMDRPPEYPPSTEEPLCQPPYCHEGKESIVKSHQTVYEEDVN